jgi:hypothetical protein
MNICDVEMLNIILFLRKSFMQSSHVSSAKAVSPDPIFQMAIGFWISKTLMTAVELDLFTKLSGGKSFTLEQMKDDILRMERRPAEVFVTALVSLGLLEVLTKGTTDVGDDGEKQYSNSEVAEIFLDKNKPSYIGDFIVMLDKHLYSRWDKLEQALTSNKPVQDAEGNISGGRLYDQAKINQAVEQMQMFTRSMYGISVGPAMALARVFDFSKYQKMLDIGGGSGVYPIEVVKAYPNISADILDLEPVCEVANEYIKKFNLQDRIHTKVLDFSKDQLPKDYDVALLSHIIHFFAKEKVSLLLRKIYDSLSSENGVVIISEWLLNDERTGPVPSALMSLTMVVDMPEGRNYSYSEVSKMLVDVGFKNIERRPLAGPAEIVIGYKGSRHT